MMTKSVLVLDDEPTNRGVIAFVLRAGGYEVLEAATGAAALCAGHRHRIMVLVADLRLPDMAGTEVARSLREDWPDMAILFTSGTPVQHWTHAERGTLHELSGPVDVLEKPFTPPALTQAVNALAAARTLEDGMPRHPD